MQVAKSGFEEVGIMNNADTKKNADRILYGYGLLEKLKEFGVAHIIGSYRMNMMAWNDLDIDIENDTMSLERLYELSAFITRTFHPLWYEAKEETNVDGNKVWFHGFATEIIGELWNIDLWFFDKKTISDVESYCDQIALHASQIQKDIIISIKKDLIARELYCIGQYTSMDVYKAVLENGVNNTDEFLALFK